MKNLIIVCQDSCRIFGDYLAQLISQTDDTEEETIGVKDGQVAAQVWSEEWYRDNASQISSNQYILFIGCDKLTKEKSSHMQPAFRKFGMTYGWLGRQAVLSVLKTVPEDEYPKFYAFAREYKENLDKLVRERLEYRGPSKNKVKKAVPKNPVEEMLAAAGDAMNGVANAVGSVIAFPADLWNQIDSNRKKAELEKAIRAQQYDCAIMKFYLDDLSEFLGM